MKTISKDDYLRTIGLLKLAEDYHSSLIDVEKAIATILEVENENGYYGHISDAIYGSDKYDADTMLKKLDIGVQI